MTVGTGRRGDLGAVVLIAAVGLLTSVVGLGQASLWETDEPFYVEASRQMVDTGDYLTPAFNGAPRFQKPILFYWMQAASYRLFGVSEGTARLPVAVAGVLGAIVLFALGRRLAGRGVGLMAAVAFLTMFRVAVFTRQAMTDVPVLLFILVALYGLVRTLDDERPRFAMLAWSAMALGVLTKGPMGVLPLAVWMPFLVATGRLRDGVRRLRVGAGGSLFLLLATPWYAYMVWRHGTAFLDVSLMTEVVDRLTSDTFGGPARGPLYYFSVWPADMFPWTPYFVAGVLVLVARWRRLGVASRQTGTLALVWFVTIQILFALSSNKQPHYILPAYPAAALVVALLFHEVSVMAGAGPRLALRTSGVALGLAALALGGLSLLFLTQVLGNPLTSPALLFPAVAGLGGLVIPLAHWTGPAGRAFAAVGGLTALAYGALGAFVVPTDLERLKPIKPLAGIVADDLRPGDRVGLLQNVAMGNVVSGLSFVYYTGHAVEWLDSVGQAAAFLAEPGRAFCLMRDRDYHLIRATYGQDLHVLAEGEMFMMNLSHLFDPDPRASTRTLLIVSNRPG